MTHAFFVRNEFRQAGLDDVDPRSLGALLCPFCIANRGGILRRETKGVAVPSSKITLQQC